MVRYIFQIASLVFAGAIATRADFEDGVLSEQERVILLDDHNGLRSETALGNTGDEPRAKNMVKLVWDESLAEASKAHADRCVWEHSSGDYGENIAASAASAPGYLSFSTLQDNIINWHDEHVDYNFASKSCSGVCGHYTQVVWAETVKIGCAYQMCGPGFIWDETYPFQSFLVCQYYPPGNYIGLSPYVEATSDDDIASECPDEYVSDQDSGLCVMPSTSMCMDSILNVAGTGGAGCAEIAANQEYCDYNGAPSHCPVSCNACAEFGCADSTLSFEYDGNAYTCAQLATLSDSDIQNYCQLEEAYSTCRGTCNYCNL